MTTLGWTTAVPPLAPTAACGRGAVADALAARVQDDAEAKRGWTLLRYDEWAVVLGDGDGLPWVDGVVYLGAHPGAADVLVPVHRLPTVPADVIVGAVRKLAYGGPAVALLPDDDSGEVFVLVLEKAPR